MEPFIWQLELWPLWWEIFVRAAERCFYLQIPPFTSRWPLHALFLGQCREDPGSVTAALPSMSCFGVHHPLCYRNCAVCCPEADAGQTKHWVGSKPACSWSYAPKMLQKQREEAQSWAPGCYLWLSYCVTLSSSLHLWVTVLPPQLPSGMVTPTPFARVSCGAILQWIECRKRVFFPSHKGCTAMICPPNDSVQAGSVAELLGF